MTSLQALPFFCFLAHKDVREQSPITVVPLPCLPLHDRLYSPTHEPKQPFFPYVAFCQLLDTINEKITKTPSLPQTKPNFCLS